MTSVNIFISRALAAVTVLVASSIPVGLIAQVQVDDREAELQAVRGEISRLRQQVDRLQGEERNRSHELTRIEVDLQLQKARLAEVRTRRSAVSEHLEQSRAEAAALQVRLRQTEKLLAASAQRLHGWSAGSALRWMTMNSSGDEMNQVRWLRYLVGSSRQRRATYNEQKQRLDELLSGLDAQEVELASLVTQEEQRNQELIAAYRRQTRSLTQVRRQRTQLAQTVAGLVDRERRLDEFIGLLQGRSFAGETPIQRFRGVLEPPVRARVAKGFGPQMDPRYKTKVPHNGLEYDLTGQRQTVGAVYAGEVVYAAMFQGFGLTAIVAHPGDAFSLYAGLASLRVSKGDIVALQQPVGSAEGSLYFEIRLENRPQDPSRWVR